MNRFQFVAGHHTRYGVKRLCQIIGVARSSYYYYYWTSTAPERAARDAADSALAGKIRQVHAGSDGAPRVTAELRDIGRPVNHKRVARVMRRYRIQGLRLRRRVQTTIADPPRARHRT